MTPITLTAIEPLPRHALQLIWPSLQRRSGQASEFCPLHFKHLRRCLPTPSQVGQKISPSPAQRSHSTIGRTILPPGSSRVAAFSALADPQKADPQAIAAMTPSTIVVPSERGRYNRDIILPQTSYHCVHGGSVDVGGGKKIREERIEMPDIHASAREYTCFVRQMYATLIGAKRTRSRFTSSDFEHITGLCNELHFL